jgi:hypothetical protein
MAKPAETSPPVGAVPFKWADATSLPILAAGQLHIQIVQGHAYLTFGEINLPVMLGAPPQGFVAEVRPVARFLVSMTELEDMIRALNTVLETSREKSGV